MRLGVFYNNTVQLEERFYNHCWNVSKQSSLTVTTVVSITLSVKVVNIFYHTESLRFGIGAYEVRKARVFWKNRYVKYLGNKSGELYKV
jgi:hypothetical protein